MHVMARLGRKRLHGWHGLARDLVTRRVGWLAHAAILLPAHQAHERPVFGLASMSCGPVGLAEAAGR